MGRRRTKTHYYCTDCGKELHNRTKSGKCRRCLGQDVPDPTPEEIEERCRQIRREREESDRMRGPHENLGRPEYVKRRHRLVLPEGARRDG